MPAAIRMTRVDSSQGSTSSIKVVALILKYSSTFLRLRSSSSFLGHFAVVLHPSHQFLAVLFIRKTVSLPTNLTIKAMATVRPRGLKHAFFTTSTGTKLSCYHTGSVASKPAKPILIVLHGSFSSGLTASDLALSLSDTYNVFIPSRRSRGLSGPFPDFISKSLKVISTTSSDHEEGGKGREDDDSKQRTYESEFASDVLRIEMQDLVALLSHTGSTRVLGISSGALIILKALLTLSSSEPTISNLTHIMVFEPPILFPSSMHLIDFPLVKRYEDEVAKNDLANASVTAMKITQMGPKFLRACPRWVIRFLTSLILNAEVKDEARRRAARAAKATEAKRSAGGGVGENSIDPVEDIGEEQDFEIQDLGAVSMGSLLITLRYDFAVVEAMIGPPEKFKGIPDSSRVLLLGGSESPAYLKVGLEELGRVMGAENEIGVIGGKETGAKKVILKGVGHEVLGNANRGGNVALVSRVIKDFFGE
jgi:hypothetical protein